ncbi:MAG TPA: chloride channel protein [Candidatus Saccharimonadales bacterium]|nr:chloride channel protein [Candidatus Saccharimonadales bacterium]
MKTHFVVRYLQGLTGQTRTLLHSCAYGLAAGLSAVAFQWTIRWLYGAGLVRLSHQSKVTFALGSLAIMLVSSLVVGGLLTLFCPEATGSGIPQLKLAFWKDFGTVPWRVAWVKFVAGVASIAGGASLGREGPSVQLAGAVASNLAGLAGEPKQNRRAAAAAGAAAGLAAAFNAPLAATTFVLEEIIGDLNSRLLGGVLLASVIGALAVHGIIGPQPAFALGVVETPTWVCYALTPLVAALATLVGVYFQRFSLGLRLRSKETRLLPQWCIPVLGGLITWVLGVSVFWRTGRMGVFSLGYGDLSDALAGHVEWKIAALLLAAKFVATFCCYGLGGCGGIFSPCLFFGGMVGVVVAGLLGLEWSAVRGDVVTLAVVGMSATLGGVVGAPVTGILIVFEMTHQFALVPALMLGALVSQSISRNMNKESFYDALLVQDGHRIDHVRPPRDLQSWQELPVALILTKDPVVITDLARAAIEQALKSHPYDRFPVVLKGALAGILTRREAAAALGANRPPALEPATTCRPDQTILELQKLLIDSTTQYVVVTDRDGGIQGVITLHDLLRAQVEKAGG